MSTFDQLCKRSNALTKAISEDTGVNQTLVLNLYQYARQLSAPGTPDKVDEMIFMAQLAKYFGITSKFHLHLIYECKS
ncbi:hypothetical protein PoB_002633100 [Plakobranchus ocellatus]|uniref:ACB domain-containing protein n=1 Tax=Plakobranchus ocellatus TaxID=259542 RepID=A0AAV3ZV52_9GAST|nr:hypothetical protein PoB_002633100 [Plakobranchus ocellatus]